MTPVQSVSDNTAASLAAAGGSVSTFQALTERNGQRWKTAALRQAAATSTSLSRKAGVAANSVACGAEHQETGRPIPPRPTRRHRTRRRAHPAPGEAPEAP